MLKKQVRVVLVNSYISKLRGFFSQRSINIGSIETRESKNYEIGITGNRTSDLRMSIPALYYWAKWTWAIYWHAHSHFIVNRGVWMTPNILPVSNSSRIGWILPTARTKPPWCPHHFILSFRPPQTSFARAIRSRQYIGGHPRSSIHYKVNMSVPIYCPWLFSSIV